MPKTTFKCSKKKIFSKKIHFWVKKMQKTAKIDTILIKNLITEEKCETKKMPNNMFKCSKKNFFQKKIIFESTKCKKPQK